MEVYLTALRDLVNNSGFSVLFSSMGTGNVIMLIVALALLYMAIGKGFEPLLLVPIAFGCLLVNLPLSGIMSDSEGSWASCAMFILGLSTRSIPSSSSWG